MKKSLSKTNRFIGIVGLHAVVLCATVCGCFLFIPDENPLTLTDTQLVYVEATTTSITVGWRSVPLAEEYILSFSATTTQSIYTQELYLNNPQWMYIESTGEPFHEHTIENLVPDTTYYLTIQPVVSTETTIKLGYDFSGSMVSDILEIRTSAE